MEKGIYLARQTVKDTGRQGAAIPGSLERSHLCSEGGQQNCGVGPGLWGCTGTGDGVGYWMGLGLAHSRNHNKIIALQQSECRAAQGKPEKDEE
jgi:hypothetical protein